MKHLNNFKTLIDLVYYFLLPVVIFYPAVLIYLVVFPNQEIFTIQLPDGEVINSFKTIIFLVIFYLEFMLFFFGFHELRKLASILLSKRFFTNIITIKLKKIGKLFSICGVTSIVFLFIYKLSLSSFGAKIMFGFNDYVLLLFLIIIGVFFLILSDAFKKAVQFKEENELTV